MVHCIKARVLENILTKVTNQSRVYATNGRHCRLPRFLSRATIKYAYLSLLKTQIIIFTLNMSH